MLPSCHLSTLAGRRCRSWLHVQLPLDLGRPGSLQRMWCSTHTRLLPSICTCPLPGVLTLLFPGLLLGERGCKVLLPGSLGSTTRPADSLWCMRCLQPLMKALLCLQMRLLLHWLPVHQPDGLDSIGTLLQQRPLPLITSICRLLLPACHLPS